MRILITGLEGFTGRYVQEELEEHGYEVLGFTGDLTDNEAVRREVAALKPDAVIHLAAVAFVGHGDAKAFYEVNLIGTRNLLAALAEYTPDIQSILLASSANIYGNSSEGRIPEDTVPAPANDYAVSKVGMEYMARLWQTELPICIARPFNYTGVGQDEKFLVPKIISHFRRKKETIELGNLDVWREFGDVRAVAYIYRKLLEKNPTGETVNVCTGKAHSLREVVRLCEEITGHTINIRVNPEFIRSNEVKILFGDNRRLTALIGQWQRPKLKDTLTWMLNAP